MKLFFNEMKEKYVSYFVVDFSDVDNWLMCMIITFCLFAPFIIIHHEGMIKLGIITSIIQCIPFLYFASVEILNQGTFGREKYTLLMELNESMLRLPKIFYKKIWKR